MAAPPKTIAVLFSARDCKAIEVERARRSRLSGYDVTVSDVLRALVREQVDRLEDEGAPPGIPELAPLHEGDAQ